MADSSNNNLSSSGEDGSGPDRSTHALPELSVSRRVKIGSVLLLMLCGYFLMDDRPRPATITEPEAAGGSADQQMQQFIDELEFVDSVESFEQLDRVAELESQQLQNSPPPLETFPQLPVSVSEQPVTSAPAHQGMHHRPSRPPQIAIRPGLRFTGRIEPLH